MKQLPSLIAMATERNVISVYSIKLSCMHACIFPSIELSRSEILTKFDMNNIKASGSNSDDESMTLIPSNRPGSIATKPYSNRFRPNLVVHLSLTLEWF